MRPLPSQAGPAAALLAPPVVVWQKEGPVRDMHVRQALSARPPAARLQACCWPPRRSLATRRFGRTLMLMRVHPQPPAAAAAAGRSHKWTMRAAQATRGRQPANALGASAAMVAEVVERRLRC